jgi:hypothetical protein
MHLNSMCSRLRDPLLPEFLVKRKIVRRVAPGISVPIINGPLHHFFRLPGRIAIVEYKLAGYQKGVNQAIFLRWQARGFVHSELRRKSGKEHHRSQGRVQKHASAKETSSTCVLHVVSLIPDRPSWQRLRFAHGIFRPPLL